MTQDTTFDARSVRPPAVAGMFYPAEPARLRADVERLLEAAGSGAAAARAVIAPHAGYVYSGSTAAVAYGAAALAAARRVAILGPTHRVAIRGLAVPQARAWRTPLGDVAVDVADVLDLPQVGASDHVSAQEHSAEVHVPFVQVLAPDAVVAPFAVGQASADAVADVIERLLADAGTVVVISSDLSHYLPYDVARRVDERTLRQVVALEGELDHEQACGATPVNGLMEHARRHGLGLELLAACSSGDTAGDKRGVVGYAALALTGEVER